MNALWYTGPGSYEVKQMPVPQIGDNDVLLKSMCLALSKFVTGLPLLAYRYSYSSCMW